MASAMTPEIPTCAICRSPMPPGALIIGFGVGKVVAATINSAN